jgi:hypothetical protein
MLEGQVAILSSGYLKPAESLKLLRALRRSELYRPDQQSYLLYPDRRLPRFEEKNNIPRTELKRCPLLQRLLADGNCEVVERDVAGQVHFNGAFRNASDLRRALDCIAARGYAQLVKADGARVHEIFEKLFRHQDFTGRSGSFFAYEGLGSIYWHMVSKLLLAAQETFYRAVRSDAPDAVVRGLATAYYDIRNGIGENKTPDVYGAFPFEPYSHTPRHRGASQPGLTGQVKEDILCRWGELGVMVDGGKVRFEPWLLRPKEFLTSPNSFSFFGTDGKEHTIKIPIASLAFTFCQVPVVYRKSSEDSLVIEYLDGTRSQRGELSLDGDESQSILRRMGRIRKIEAAVTIPRHYYL